MFLNFYLALSRAVIIAVSSSEVIVPAVTKLSRTVLKSPLWSSCDLVVVFVVVTFVVAANTAVAIPSCLP